MDFEIITSTITSTTQYLITVPQTDGQTVLYTQSITAGEVLIAGALWSIVVYLIYTRIMITLRGK